ncbi:MAG: phosphate ABC transporter permease subunit PstC [Candidatus Didemnitutus sp.]|nr:phosphate ABC transporter permease subunit PstC [Candidatus Didemnitutus sp.]
MKLRFRTLDPWRWAGLAGVAALALALLAALGLIAAESLPGWRHAGAGLLTEAEWFYRAERFGALAMIHGSVVVAGVALLLALPLGLGAAVFFGEYLPPGARLAAKVAVELLAAVPSVVYGLLGVVFLRGWMHDLLAPWDAWSGDTLLTAGVLVAVMILPTLTTLCDDALRDVPAAQRQAARGLGLTRAEAVLTVALPQAWPGIVAAALLALGRALGETVAVFLVIGRMDNQWPERLLSFASLTVPGQTLTSKLGGAEVALAVGDPVHWGALMALVLVLLALSGGSVLTAGWLRGRKTKTEGAA